MTNTFKGRSNNWTRGLSVTNLTNKARFFFFEIDFPFIEAHHRKIVETYAKYGIDLLIHRSFNGVHYLSSSLLSKQGWKMVLSELQEINPKFPALCLRMKPNKYPNEESIWYNKSVAVYNNENPEMTNSLELSQLLNKMFGSKFKGMVHTELKFVNYKMPFITAKHLDIQTYLNHVR